jgi:hypothetical protein
MCWSAIRGSKWPLVIPGGRGRGGETSVLYKETHPEATDVASTCVADDVLDINPLIQSTKTTRKPRHIEGAESERRSRDPHRQAQDLVLKEPPR